MSSECVQIDAFCPQRLVRTTVGGRQSEGKKSTWKGESGVETKVLWQRKLLSCLITKQDPMGPSYPLLQLLTLSLIHEQKIPWRRKWQPTPIVLPGESYGQRSLVGYSPWGYKGSHMIEVIEHTYLKYFFQIFVEFCLDGTSLNIHFKQMLWNMSITSSLKC